MSVMGNKTAEAAPAGVREYLTFRLDKEEYGIDILKVQEIRGYESPTRIANAPEFIKGVVNLRGTNIRERVELLISIAHPRFREELRRQARELGLVFDR